jgi:hypothetical protein
VPLSFFNSYLARFRQLGTRGVDLLSANDKLIAEYGIVGESHVSRFKVGVEALRKHQQKVDDVIAAESKEQKEEKEFHLLKNEYEEIMLTQNSYAFPPHIDSWTPRDLYAFFQLPENKNISIFCKFIALNQYTGAEIVEFSSSLEALREAFRGPEKKVFPPHLLHWLISP